MALCHRFFTILANFHSNYDHDYMFIFSLNNKSLCVDLYGVKKVLNRMVSGYLFASFNWFKAEVYCDFANNAVTYFKHNLHLPPY